MNSSNENLNPGRRYPSPATLRYVSIAYILLFALFVAGCHTAGRGASDVQLTLIDQAWVDKEYQLRLREQLLEFKKQTGIQVEVLPAPEAAVEQLLAWRRLLESGAKAPDVYAIDVIWPGILEDNLTA